MQRSTSPLAFFLSHTSFSSSVYSAINFCLSDEPPSHAVAFLYLLLLVMLATEISVYCDRVILPPGGLSPSLSPSLVFST